MMTTTPRHPKRIGLAASGAAFFVAIFAGAGCDNAVEPTLVHLDFVARGSGVTVDNEHGYAVELSEARVALVSVELHAGDTFVAQRRPATPPLRRVVDAVLGIPSAHAHPGHYEAGGLMGEWLESDVAEQVEITATAPRFLGEGEGITGHHGSASVGYGALNDGVSSVVVAGTARKDGTDIPFAASLSLIDHVVEGVPVGLGGAGVEVAGAATVNLTLDAHALLGAVDFARVENGAFVVGTQPHNAFERGARGSALFSIGVSP